MEKSTRGMRVCGVMRRAAARVFLTLVFTAPLSAHAEWGDATISAMAGPWPIAITTCSHDAGAICSLTWRNKQFIDDFDHGRQLQSATSFDGLGEAFNPTEAGSEPDGHNPRPSTSVLHNIHTTINNGTQVANVLATHSQMAFWRPVGGVALSNHTLKKEVTIGLPGMAHVIEYRTEFKIPANETHTHGVFEALTGYMPAEFSQFYTFDVKQNAADAATLSDGPGEQSLPIIFSTPNGGHAMGIYSPDSPQAEWPTAGYGRWRFPAAGVVKWNNVFRVNNPVGTYRFRSYVAVGTLENVKVSLTQLHDYLAAMPDLTGDYDVDGDVDGADLLVWQRSHGMQTARFAGADGNGDGIVDGADYGVWLTQFAASPASLGAGFANANQAVTHVPEPSSAAAATLAWAILSCCKRAASLTIGHSRV